jgi:hypothetical protein
MGLVVVHGAQISIRMDDEDVIRRIHRIMDFGNFYELPERRANGRLVTQYNYQIASAEHVCAFLAAVWRFLGNRRKTVATEALRSARQVGNHNFAHPWTPERRARYAATMARKRADMAAALAADQTGTNSYPGT